VSHDSALIGKTIAVQYLTLFLGMGWGWGARSHVLPTCWLAAAVLSVVLLGLGPLEYEFAMRRPLEKTIAVLLAILLVYDSWIVSTDPFFEAQDEYSFVFGVILIVLPLMSLKALIRRRMRLAALGVMLFQATEIASLFYNYAAIRGGVGYFRVWVS
jgi:hypothetical protein